MFSQEDKFYCWTSEPRKFNQWRRENDLKGLFNYILRHSVSFEKWTKEQNLNLDELLSITPTRHVFYGKATKWCFVTETDGIKDYAIYETKPSKDERKIIKSFQYLPYFKWKREKDNTCPFVINTNGAEFNENNFMVNGFESSRSYTPDNIEVEYITKIFGELPLLKIGKYRLASNFSIFSRNLDFLDLDQLELFGDSSLWYQGLDVYCSTIRMLKLSNLYANMFKIKYCFCSQLMILNSTIMDFEISYSYMSDFVSGMYIERSKLINFKLEKVVIDNISIYDTELNSFIYNPPQKGDIGPVGLHPISYLNLYKNIKRLRIAFENMDNTTEASNYYYLERCLKIKNFKEEYRTLPPKFDYSGGSYFKITKDWIKKRIDSKLAMLYFRRRTKQYFISITNNEYRNSRITMIVNHYWSKFEKVFWGFGEKPLRIIFNALLIILLFSLIYFFTNMVNIKGNFINSIYFSVITFTTLGYGDITPQTSLGQIFVSIEALLGAFTIGFVIAAYTKKSRT
ncbi:MAG: hypothetical protein K0Q49_1752 [Haloplasmataceae bacterium]|jgi:hypothetical protein|nr:hypothetical protein [Haloplasmataceae bacterium]